MDQRSEDNLEHVHPDLVKLVHEAAEHVSFVVIEGLRTLDQEKKNVASGHSQTLHSRHLPNKDGVACAVDIMATPGGKVSWEPHDYTPIDLAFRLASHNLSIPVQWGGDWSTLKDYGHFQLPWESYP